MTASEETIRLGFIVPSSNTAFEPESTRLLAGRYGVSAHVSRVRVTDIGLDDASREQFRAAAVADAASMLADAAVDALVWAGTAGLWLGLDSERRLLQAVRDETGVPAGSSSLALVDACRAIGVTRVSLVTPYSGDVVERIIVTLASVGIDVVWERHLGIRHNYSFALVADATIMDMILAARAPAEAVLVACTNMAASAVAARLPASFGLPVIDSVAATVEHALGIARGGSQVEAAAFAQKIDHHL